MSWHRVSWLAAVVVVVVAATPRPAVSSTGAEAQEQESHCVVEVIGQDADGELVVGPAVCFDTLADALGDAVFGLHRTGRMGLGLEGPMRADFVLGTHFDGANGSGSSISVKGSSCTGGWWNTPSSWDNRISSSYNGCYRLAHYDYPNKGGDRYDTTGVGQTDNLSAAMNNRTESVAYHGS